MSSKAFYPDQTLTLIDSVQMGFIQSDKQYSLLLTTYLCASLGLALFSISVYTFSILICSFYICHLWVILSQSSFVTARKHYSKPDCIQFVRAMCFCDDIKGALMKKGTS